ncbi:MAG: FAD-dependent thymidylate synthase [bacterium]|nr:FAD-dependent thymidylate synthase [bacterium]
MPETHRPVNLGAEQWLEKPIECLDHGFVRLVDYMGDDSAIVQAARVSYGKGTKKANEDRGLIRYLLRHRHTTPFEMCELKFHCKMPIFVARQWIRHRTANVNEYSARYSVLDREFYLPEALALKKQSMENRQGRAEELTPEEQAKILTLMKSGNEAQYRDYEEFLRIGLARELARIGISVSAYTQWYWKIDLHNLLHFLSLRMDEHAQWEIRVFAEAMAKIVKDAFPLVWEAFEDYRLNSMSLSRVEVEILSEVGLVTSRFMDNDALRKYLNEKIGNKREVEEFLKKFKTLNIQLG